MAKLIIFGLMAIVIFYLVPLKYRKYQVLIASVVFYTLIDWKMLFVLVLTSIWTWWYALYGNRSRKSIMIGCLPLVLLLMFFKINQFFVAEAATFLDEIGLGTSMRTFALIMPIGISYYVFKAISYLVDAYTGKGEVEKELVNVLLYLSFFPEIMSGPISKYDRFKHAIVDGMRYSEEKVKAGIYLIIKGIFMKAVIANRLVDYTDAIFKNPSGYPALALWMGAFFYTVQLYCDFAGYSSIAIGITQIMGLHLQENFNRPYLSASIGEFWGRWHISLSTWLKEYVYFPLGGSRGTKFRTKINLFIVFLVSGLWHGSGFQFLIWGGYHGILRMLMRQNKKDSFRIIHVATTFCLVCFGWIIFRSESCKHAYIYISSMFMNLSLSVGAVQNAILPFTNDNSCIAFFLIIMIFIIVLFAREIYEEKKGIGAYELASLSWQIFLVVSILLFGNMRTSNFIYANF